MYKLLVLHSRECVVYVPNTIHYYVLHCIQVYINIYILTVYLNYMS